jgi:hypothetical protein
MTTTVGVMTALHLEQLSNSDALEMARAELAKVKSQRSALYFTLLKNVCEGIFKSEKKLLAMIAQLEAEQAQVSSIN